MMKFLKSNKMKQGAIATAFTAVFIVVVIIINILFTILTDRFPSMNLDLTAQGLNTLSEDSIEVAEGVTKPTEIIFIGSEEAVMGDQIYTAEIFRSSQVANLALRMQEMNSNISVSFVDPDVNPELMSEYSNENLQIGYILVRTEDRHKVLTDADLVQVMQNQTDGSYKYATMADGALANALHVTNLDNVPLIAVGTGHDEILDSASRAGMDEVLKDNGFDVVEFNIITDPIPEGTDVLMLTAPTTDYSVGEIETIEEYLSNQTQNISLFYIADPTQPNLPNFNKFLNEWGIDVNSGMVLESDESKMYMGSQALIFPNSVYEGFSENTYPYMLTAGGSPLEILFTYNDDVGTYSLIESADTAYVSQDQTVLENPETGVQTMGVLGQRLINTDDGTVYTNVVVMSGVATYFSDFFTNTGFANAEYTIDLLQMMTDTSDYSNSLYIPATDTNLVDITTDYATIQALGIYTFTIGVPAVILIIGLVIFFRRRHL